MSPTLEVFPGASLFPFDHSVSGAQSLQWWLEKATDDLAAVLLSILIITSVNGLFFRSGIMYYSPVYLEHLTF